MLVAAAAVLATASALAGDDDFYQPTPKYIWGGDASIQYDSAEAACQAGMKDLVRKFTFNTVKPGAGDVLTCVFQPASASSSANAASPRARTTSVPASPGCCGPAASAIG